MGNTDSVSSDHDITRSEDHSYYQKGDDRYPPVTSIIRELEQDTTGLEIWRTRNDGLDDAAQWQHLLWYARNRGTLAHHDALAPLADRQLWGPEERDSIEQIMTGPKKSVRDEWNNADADVSTCMTDIVYSVMANHRYKYPDTRSEYDGNAALLDVLEHDIDYFTEKFDRVKQLLGITDESVIAVEQFLVNEQYGYGGQADLLYEDPDGNVVLADLKTSSGLRHTHRLQGVAYKHAIEAETELPTIADIDTVHREEVIRINPDNEDIEIHSHVFPDHVNRQYGTHDECDWYDTDAFLVDQYGNFEYEDMNALWATFESLTQQYHQKYDTPSND